MNVGVLKRILTVLAVGGIMLWLFWEPSDNGNIINNILEILSKRVLSNLGGVE
tara:strand:- start:346 stop:504 length:159 start_codon:yes stop_codon:yes gene_type:complete